MSKLIKSLVGAALVGMFLFPANSDAGVRVYVKIGPPVRTVKVVRQARPHRHAVWVSGHYAYRGGRHVWVSGHWARGRTGFVYVQPHWKKTRHGSYFVAGHWVKK